MNVVVHMSKEQIRKRAEKSKKTLENISKKADSMGLSYGQLMALKYMEQNKIVRKW